MRRFRSRTAMPVVLPLLVLAFFIHACQANGSPAPAATRVPQTAVPVLPATSTPTIPAPTVLAPTQTPRPSATPSAAPLTAAREVPLSSGGPWLLYWRAAQHAMGGISESLFVANQDGSGSRRINPMDCDSSAPLAITADPANRLVRLQGKFVLINLERAEAQYISPGCKTKFSGDAAGGLLATIDHAEGSANLPGANLPVANTPVAELRVYALPEGKLRGAFSIPPCSASGQPCGFDTDTGYWVAQWDPSGRYLIFPVTLDGAGSALYLYDAQNNAIRQMGSVEGRVSRIWWSPGGSNALLGVSLSGDFMLESFWAAAVASGNVSRLTPADAVLADVELLDWLDENRFLFYRGSLRDVVTVGAADLRLLDIRSGKETTLLSDGFIEAELSRQTAVVGMIVAVYNGQYEDGVYLVPAAKPTPQKIAPLENYEIQYLDWNEGLGLFVTDAACQAGGQGVRAFDSQGKWQCVPDAAPTPTLPALDSPSPDAQWRAVMRDGLWLEKTGQPAVKVHAVTPNQMIWRPDSGGLFFTAKPVTQQANQGMGLYYLSLPDLKVQSLDDPEALEAGAFWGAYPLQYQWILK